MSSLNLIPIGNLFDLEKGSLQSSKCTEGEYTFITAAQEWKTHNEYSHECEALIFAAAASGSLGRTHYINDKFITSDLCFILTPKDSKKYPINLKFCHFVFNSLKDEIVKNTKSGTSKESINQSNLRNYEIPYFEIDKQNLWIDKLVNTKSIKEDLELELSTGQSLLKQLKQTILQEAIEGKLTAKWRAKNSDIGTAKELLEQIKTEKEKLVKDKKIKASKPLSPINEDEIPFDIPQSWEWCRTDDICLSISSGSTPSKDAFIGDDGIAYLKVYNIQNQKIDFHYKPQFIKPEINNTKLKRSILYPQDVVMNIVGPPLGKIAIIPNTYPQWNCNQAIVHFKLVEPLIHKYLYYFLRELSFLKYIHFKGVAGQDNISITQSRSILFPLPPLEEQKEIVATIEKLFAICDELEGEINQNKTTVENLMATVLKEAFEQQ
jgi:type I restriction enzyme, S subunit